MPVVGSPSSSSNQAVTLAEAKAHMRVDHSDEDTHITNLIKAANKWMETQTRRRFINQTITLKLDEFPADGKPIVLPFPPLSSVTSIQYVDEDGNTQTWASSNYTVDTDYFPGRVYRNYNVSYPDTRTIENAVTVTYVSGYGTSSDNVPDPIRQAVLLLVAHWYENREEATAGNVVRTIPTGVQAVVGQYRHQEAH